MSVSKTYYLLWMPEPLHRADIFKLDGISETDTRPGTKESGDSLALGALQIMLWRKPIWSSHAFTRLQIITLSSAAPPSHIPALEFSVFFHKSPIFRRTSNLVK